MTKKIIVILILLNFYTISFAYSFNIIEMNESYMRLSFEVPDYNIITSPISQPGSDQIDIIDAELRSEENKAILPYFADAVGIPEDGDINIKVLKKNTRNYSNIDLKRAAQTTIENDEVNYISNYPSKSDLKNELYPQQIATKEVTAFIGDRRFASFNINPFQYNEVSKDLLVHEYIEFEIYIQGNTSINRKWQFSDNFIDQVADDFFINNKFSQKWRKDLVYDQHTTREAYIHNAINITVREDGLYKIDYDYLQEKISAYQELTGIPLGWNLDNIDPRNLSLESKNGYEPIYFAGEEDGSFDPGDYFEFYGIRNAGDKAFYGAYTSKNVYKLRLTDSFASRMAIENGGIMYSNPLDYIEPENFDQTIHFENQSFYEKLGKGYDYDRNYYREDNYFWRKIKAPNLEIVPFNLQYPADLDIKKFDVNVALFGLTYNTFVNDHQATVRLNQGIVGSEVWTGQTEKIFSSINQVHNSFLTHGENNLYISLSGETPSGDDELVALDYFDLTYWREYRTDLDQMKFKKPRDKGYGLYQFVLKGFQDDQVSIYKIGSSKLENVRIEPAFELSSAPYIITFQDMVNSEDINYFAVTEANKKRPLDISIDQISDLKATTNNYDNLIITTRDFVSSEGLALYQSLWAEMGHNTKIIDVQDIYDEFNHGIESADAIKDFLTYAYYNWASPRVKSVLLVGDATYNVTDNSPTAKYNIIPYRKIWTWKHGVTASDNWYGCVVGDDPIAEIAISRISVWEPEQIMDIAQKSYVHIKEPKYEDLAVGHITLSAGGKITDNHNNFAVQSELIARRMINNDYRVSRVYTSASGLNDNYYGSTYSLKDKIDQGTNFLQFMGHGGGRVWADYNLLHLNDLKTLNNDYYPFVSSLACYSSSFEYPGSSSISEAFISEPGKGAIATLGFSGLGFLTEDLIFGTALADGYFRAGLNNLAEVLNYTKAKYYVKSSYPARLGLTAGCILMGDPNIPLYKAKNQLEVVTDKELYAPGDTIRVALTNTNESVNRGKLYIIDKDGIVKNIPYYLPLNEGIYQHTYSIPADEEDGQFYRVRMESYNESGVFLGEKMVGIGKSNITNVTHNPVMPTVFDSVSVSCNILSQEEITSVELQFVVSQAKDTSRIPMILEAGSEHKYVTTQTIPKQFADKEIRYTINVTTESGENIVSNEYTYVVLAPDLALASGKLITLNDLPQLEYLVVNTGNTVSAPTNVVLSSFDSQSDQKRNLYEGTLPALEVSEEYQLIIPIEDYEIGLFIYEVMLNNNPLVFSEISHVNNSFVIETLMNYQTIGNNGGLVTSIDDNAELIVPANYHSDMLFNIVDSDYLEPNMQPDVDTVVLNNGEMSRVYDMTCLTAEVADSTGLLLNGNLDIKIKYASNDSTTVYYASNNQLKLYRWDDRYDKWLAQTSFVSTQDATIRANVNRLGKYTLLRSKDTIIPHIDPNVQEQEFTQGGYVSGKGTISVVLSDANGIDVEDNRFAFFLNGEAIPEEDLIITQNDFNINNIPIKYHLDLPKGNYTLVVDCTDVNGNFNSLDITFKVNTKFDVINIANYPNPIIALANEPINDGRTRFTYTLTDDADNVSISVYTVSGRKVIEFDNLPNSVGYHEYPRSVYGWDCKDRQGYDLANGVYFYKVVAKKAGKRIEKIQKMAIIK